ncbi:L-type lectin-domain containing receptor kinase S.7-like isoform X3 [Monomorium pharaonis]|uniref:L-type lectin-domain containing receptor kinase S.7-like isoform X3 n=1 Tax=Monomorium pharaonis TaxID=307658 RepID=UPI00174623EB|nr:L-type lectin-domain containing receptor kinase S.7-like isoform X3 [Monomorium pharaonis]XP_036145624.1 L-type lectin-domain containing receptor kinase S.7-like isoform X3 [Monomorium pharaonis]XP_036145625.1 L-type lectin-domain containing receptor kinase S.7-like isoform X3 [Monomorium pharaonis]XP_036145626.1 L-type lectin-domain containing receptor kinase S.7-like isoform X3 [Monomorium pharaonis]XP_036145627.1 L-type lectin-domain containing receptor kinase S.7-like isoform X3 [Monomor
MDKDRHVQEMSQTERSVVKHGPKDSPSRFSPLPPSPPPLPPPPPPPLPKLPTYSHQKLFKKCKSATFQLDGATYTIVASPPDRRVTKDDIGVASASVAVNNAAVSGCSSGTASSRSHNPSSSPGRNGQLSKQGTLTIVRRSSGKNKSISGGNFESSPSPHNPDTSYLSSQSVDLEEILDNVDLTTDSLPAVDTPDACDKAALRLRCLLRQLQHGEISAELLQRNLHYAARVLEAVFIDETKVSSGENECARSSRRGAGLTSSSLGGGLDPDGPQSHAVVTQKRKLRTPVWARLRNIHISNPLYDLHV